jgi:iron complex outermembrane recepter protein
MEVSTVGSNTTSSQEQSNAESPARARRLRRTSVGAAAALLCSIGLVSSFASAQTAPKAQPRAQDPAPPPPPAGEQPPPPPEEPAPPPEEPAPPPEEPPAAPPPAEPVPVDAAPPGGEPPPAEAGDAPPASDGDAEAGEVVVTVDRRRKDLQDYSGTTSAFSEAQLSAIGVGNVRDLSVTTPGLQIGTQESGTTIYIRGIGSDNNTELGDPAVALHVDGVYMPRARGLGNIFYDLQRVEVNSGPQGTLRGRNAVGGTVNVVTNQPRLGEFQAYGQATFGSYSLRQYQGMVNIPIGDTIAVRVAGISNVHDSYWENAGPVWDLKGAQSADDFAIRATARWQPVKAVDVTVAYDYMREAGTGYIGANWNGALTRVNDNGTPADTTDDIPDPVNVNDIDNPRRVYQRGAQAWSTLYHQGVRLSTLFDAGPVLFEAMGSFRDLDYKQTNGANAGGVYPGQDISGINPDVWGATNYWHYPSKSYIGELRAFAPDTDRLRWTAGLFYFREDQATFLGQVNDNVGGFGGGEFNMPNTLGTSLAGYADATFDVVKTLRVLGGIRVTREHKERTDGYWGLINGLPPAPAGGYRYGTEGFQYKGQGRTNFTPVTDDPEGRVNLYLDGIQSFGARDTFSQAFCNDPEAGNPRLELNDQGSFRCANGVRSDLATTAPNIFAFVPQNNSVTSTFVDWRGGVEFDAADDNLLYATVSTGHKAAGFNDTQNITGVDEFFDSEYGEESVLSVELGSKNLFLDKSFKLNGSAFWFTYSGMQFQTIVAVAPDPDPTDNNGPPSSAVRQNAQETTYVYGADIDAIYSLPLNLEAELHVLLMDARFSDGTYVNDSRLGFNAGGPPRPNAGNAEVDLGGLWLPRVSPFTFNYNLSQLIFSDIGTWDWVIQGQTRGTHYMTVYNGDGTRLVKPGPNFDTENPALPALEANPARFYDKVPTYTVFNIGAGWKHPDGRIGISGYINNVFNITYANTIASTNGTNIRFYNNQRLAGIRVRVDW